MFKKLSHISLSEISSLMDTFKVLEQYSDDVNAGEIKDDLNSAIVAIQEDSFPKEYLEILGNIETAVDAYSGIHILNTYIDLVGATVSKNKNFVYEIKVFCEKKQRGAKNKTSFSVLLPLLNKKENPAMILGAKEEEYTIKLLHDTYQKAINESLA